MDQVIQNANNVPVHTPLFSDPFVPYHCPDNKTLSVYCKGDASALAGHLAPTPFELVSDIFLVYISDFTNCDKVGFMDAGIMLSVRYKGRIGGYVLYEYENDDGAMAAGRELWGYPKKFADIELRSDDTQAAGFVRRKGQKIFEVGADLTRPTHATELKLTPHFNVRPIAAPDGGLLSRHIIERDTSSDFVTHTSVNSAGSAVLATSLQDPFHLLGSFEVLGANLTIGDFHATETNGWGKIVETL
jgi:acetoacetate decarboxylase